MLVVLNRKIDDAKRNNCLGIQRSVPEFRSSDRDEGEIVRTDLICRDRSEAGRTVDDRPVREHLGRGWQCLQDGIGHVIRGELS